MKSTKLILLAFIVGFSISSCKKAEEETSFKDYEGEWEGTYSGDESGLWDATIDSKGKVTGIARLNVMSEGYDLVGSVSPKGVFTATVGSLSNGTTFTGDINESNDAVSGTWENTTRSTSGTWEGIKE